MEPKYKNIKVLNELKNLKDITIPPECFSDKELIFPLKKAIINR